MGGRRVPPGSGGEPARRGAGPQPIARAPCRAYAYDGPRGTRVDVLQAAHLQRLEERIAASRRELLLWMLGSWASVMVVLLGTLFAVLKTR